MQSNKREIESLPGLKIWYCSFFSTNLMSIYQWPKTIFKIKKRMGSLTIAWFLLWIETSWIITLRLQFVPVINRMWWTSAILWIQEKHCTFGNCGKQHRDFLLQQLSFTKNLKKKSLADKAIYLWIGNYHLLNNWTQDHLSLSVSDIFCTMKMHVITE